MEQMIRQKVGNEDWATARQKLIKEAQARKPNFIKTPRVKKRY